MITTYTHNNNCIFTDNKSSITVHSSGGLVNGELASINWEFVGKVTEPLTHI